MEVQFTPDQEAFVRQAIESGRLSRQEDAVQEALSMWEQRERVRVQIQAAVESAETSLALAEGRPVTQDAMNQLAHDVKLRGRARLAAEQKTGQWCIIRSRPRLKPTSTTSGTTSPRAAAVSTLQIG